MNSSHECAVAAPAEWIAASAGADLSDIECLLQDVALSMAFQITPRNPQYVIKRILADDCYKIISGMPPYSERHGIGEVGHLRAPVPKRALLDAILENRIVAIDDAANDEAVGCYMAGHIRSKNIQSIAIVPIGRDAVRWLIVLDKVPPSEKGFTGRELEHLEACKSSTERSLLHLSQEIVETSQRTLQNALREYAHLFRNPLTVIGGFARKLKEARDPERMHAYADIIYDQARRLEEDFCSFMTLVSHLFPSGHGKVVEPLGTFLEPFLADPRYRVEGDERILNATVLVLPEAAQALFGEVRKYLLCSSRSAEQILIELEREPGHAVLVFHSTAFQQFKENTDVRLPIFRQVTYQLDGDWRIGKGWCRISLPYGGHCPR